MTQPVQEPTQGRAIASLKWSQSQLFRRPSPVPAAAGTQQLFPTFTPRMPVVPNLSGHRRWPGGVVCVNAKTYNVGGTVVNNTDQNSFWYDGTNFKVVTDTQALDASTDGSATISFGVGAVGLIPKVKYRAVVSWRYPAAAAGFQARGYVSRTLASVGWEGFGSAGTNVATPYFGMMMTANNVAWASATDTVDVKVGYLTSGGSAAVEIDYVIFIPANADLPLDLTGPPTPVIHAGFDGGQFLSQPGTNGPTCSMVGTDVHSPFGQESWTDSQNRRDVLDPDFDFTFGSIGLQSAYYYARMASYYPDFLTYPSHIYVPCRLRAADAADDQFLWDSQSFVTLMENGMPIDTAPIITPSWQLVYLGCHYLNNPNSLAVCLWTAPAEGTDPRSPFEFSDPAFFDTPLIDKSVYGATSYLDQIEWNE